MKKGAAGGHVYAAAVPRKDNNRGEQLPSVPGNLRPRPLKEPIPEFPPTPEHFSRPPPPAEGEKVLEKPGSSRSADVLPIMVAFGAHADALLRTFLCLSVVSTAAAAQYETSSFHSFPAEELLPLAEAYGLALGHYAAQNWTESIRFLELSLRLHRLLRESARYCARHCDRDARHEPGPSCAAWSPDLRAYWHVLMRASCAQRCRARFPALQLPPPGRLVLEEFRRRSPYRYLHFAHSRVSNSGRSSRIIRGGSSTHCLRLPRLSPTAGRPAERRALRLHLPAEEPPGPGDEQTDGGVQEPLRPERVPHRPRGGTARGEPTNN